jgi:hypothetical protein
LSIIIKIRIPGEAMDGVYNILRLWRLG